MIKVAYFTVYLKLIKKVVYFKNYSDGKMQVGLKEEKMEVGEIIEKVSTVIWRLIWG